MSSFIRELLIDLPLTLYPVAMAMVTIFLFLILFMTFGYSLRLPFFLSIEPSPYHAVTGGSPNQQAIEDNTKRLMEQVYLNKINQEFTDQLYKQEKFFARL